MKAQSKHFLNMTEVDSHHLTAMAKNKEHLCTTNLKTLLLHLTLLSFFHKFILQEETSVNNFLFKYSFQASCVDNSIEFHSK